MLYRIIKGKEKGMYKKWIITLAVYVMLLFCFIKVLAYDVLKKDTVSMVQTEVSSGQRVVDYAVLEREPCYELTKADYECLLRIVQAEAGCEDTEGKMLVAGVVLNRVENESFPDSVTEVVMQKEGDTYQFSPVGNGSFYQVQISEETKEAVERVLEGEDLTEGALYFAARRYVSDEKMAWFDNHLCRLFRHGGHEFFR